jgi:hypothetical protein
VANSVIVYINKNVTARERPLYEYTGRVDGLIPNLGKILQALHRCPFPEKP